MGEETEKPPAGRVSIFVIAKTFLAKKRASRAVLEHRKSADDVAPLRHEQLGIDAASFRTQGNADHYSRSALERRAALRFEPDIVRWMQSYYRTFVSPHNNKRFKASHGGYAPIDREEMLAVQIKICKALFPPDEWDFAACAESAEADWQREVGADAELMSRAQFFDSLFEIVDVWTVDISLAEYVNFLKAVFHRITVAGSDVDLHPDAGPKTGSEALKHKRLSSKRLLDPDQRFWAPTCEIVSLHEDAPPDDAGADAAGSPGGAGGAGGAPPRAPMLHKTSSRSLFGGSGRNLFGGSGRNLLGGSGRNLLGAAGEGGGGGGGGGGSPVGRKPLGQKPTGLRRFMAAVRRTSIAIQFTRTLKSLHEETQARLREKARLAAWAAAAGADGAAEGRGAWVPSGGGGWAMSSSTTAATMRRPEGAATAAARGCLRGDARWAMSSSTTAAMTRRPDGAATAAGRGCRRARRTRRASSSTTAARMTMARPRTAAVVHGYHPAAAARA